ncbi:MAG: hypothetical protein E6G03_11085 [Actinobacteria bacterium]|nr:MAG: hypothetical protein E6G03_11085 [Actinomycetota bacterium]
MEERAQQLDARKRELDRIAADLDERGTWLTEAVSRVEAREAEAAEQIERAAAEARRVERREQEFDDWTARLDDRDRRLSAIEGELTEWRKRMRDEERRQQAGEPA